MSKRHKIDVKLNNARQERDRIDPLRITRWSVRSDPPSQPRSRLRGPERPTEWQVTMARNWHGQNVFGADGVMYFTGANRARRRK